MQDKNNVPTTAHLFNEKWKHRLEENHYGLAIYDAATILFLDSMFTQLEEMGIVFIYSQIKWKFDRPRVYMDIGSIAENDFIQLIEQGILAIAKHTRNE